MDRYRQNCVTLGKPVRVISPKGTETGIAETVLENGALQVLFDNGVRKEVNSGEVSVRGLWDYL